MPCGAGGVGSPSPGRGVVAYAPKIRRMVAAYQKSHRSTPHCHRGMGMLLSILIGWPVTWGVGYLFFWALGLQHRSVERGLRRKFAGYRSHRKLRGDLIGLNFLWGPILLVGGFALVSSLGWPDGSYVVAFLLGYAFAFWLALIEPKDERGREDAPDDWQG